jgi:ribose 5-phosphate isomerase B
MNIVIGADHAGFAAKETVRSYLVKAGHDVTDVGTTSAEPVDFPDIAVGLCRRILSGRDRRGIMVCGTGVGACMAANKIAGIRAALAHDLYSAHQCVEHDDANVLCVGAQIIGPVVMQEIICSFLAAEWSPEEEFHRRVAKLAELENGQLPPALDDSGPDSLPAAAVPEVLGIDDLAPGRGVSNIRNAP